MIGLAPLSSEKSGNHQDLDGWYLHPGEGSIWSRLRSHQQFGSWTQGLALPEQFSLTLDDSNLFLELRDHQDSLSKHILFESIPRSQPLKLVCRFGGPICTAKILEEPM